MLTKLRNGIEGLLRDERGGFQSAEATLAQIRDLLGTGLTSFSQRSALFSLLASEVFDNIQTTFTSPTIVGGSNYSRFLLFLDIDATLTPTNIRFIVEFSDDGGTTWYEYRQGLFASLFYEDLDTVSGLLVCFSGENASGAFRLRVVATGTTAANLFTVTAGVQFFTSP